MGAGIEAFQKDQKTFYYHQDEQLSTALVSDESGAVKNQYRYDAFGAGLEALEELPNRVRYTGQQYDRMTGQYYLRARYYNPALGRFMQEDEYQGDGMNLYAYCRNNPIIYYDPSGYDEKDIKETLSSMDYDDRLELLYKRGDEHFKKKLSEKGMSKVDKKDKNGKTYILLPTELDAMLASEGKRKDKMSPHHMPSADSVRKTEKMNDTYAAGIHMMENTHSYTFTYKMSSATRRLDYALYNSVTYEDRLIFDQYNAMMIYAFARDDVDIDVLEYKLQEQYKLAMEMRDLNDELRLYGEHDIATLERIKEKNC